MEVQRVMRDGGADTRERSDRFEFSVFTAVC